MPKLAFTSKKTLSTTNSHLAYLISQKKRDVKDMHKGDVHSMCKLYMHKQWTSPCSSLRNYVTSKRVVPN